MVRVHGGGCQGTVLARKGDWAVCEHATVRLPSWYYCRDWEVAMDTAARGHVLTLVVVAQSSTGGPREQLGQRRDWYWKVTAQLHPALRDTWETFVRYLYSKVFGRPPLFPICHQRVRYPSVHGRQSTKSVYLSYAQCPAGRHVHSMDSTIRSGLDTWWVFAGHLDGSVQPIVWFHYMDALPQEYMHTARRSGMVWGCWYLNRAAQISAATVASLCYADGQVGRPRQGMVRRGKARQGAGTGRGTGRGRGSKGLDAMQRPAMREAGMTGHMERVMEGEGRNVW
ncbi:predicted protein [Verticillium alfalfae VaMs.102]|uniref:Predicted protein n=1 Tax=Verticillium alfalfae (strain VaMs.102 / ATCC MYA-4576 / FGSC 10136) TaxID=526221 RepID=C9SBF8_VERA1|nr:predicted protein [Verticillium alfalfae VaMs.102]EEY15692.1 predicted protein [Verticillium alfalfae VaMs.102]